MLLKIDQHKKVGYTETDVVLHRQIHLVEYYGFFPFLSRCSGKSTYMNNE